MTWKDNRAALSGVRRKENDKMGFNIPLLGTNTEPEELALFEMTITKGGTLMLPIGGAYQSASQNIIFDRAIGEGHFALIDIRPSLSPLPGIPVGTLMRLFRITNEGRLRVKHLREKAKIDAITKGGGK